MADPKDDFEAPRPPVSTPDIPKLAKKKEEEKKKSGAAWASGVPAAAKSAAGVPAQLAPVAAKAGAALGAKLMLAAAAAALVGGGALAAPNFMAFLSLGRKDAPRLGAVASTIKAPRPSPELGAIASTIKAPRPPQGDSKGLQFAASGAKGQIKFEEPGGQTDGKAAGRAGKTDGGGVLPDSAPTLPHDLSGAKLRTSLGGNFGHKNIFAGGDAPKFGENTLRDRNSFAPAGARGKIAPMRTLSVAAASGRVQSMRGLKANKASSQLRNMGPYNRRIRQGGAAEAQSTAATEQFEGARGAQGQAPESPMDQLPAVDPKGTGARDISKICSYDQIAQGWYVAQDGHCARDVITSGSDVTPWRKEVQLAKMLIELSTYIFAAIAILAMIRQQLQGSSNPYAQAAQKIIHVAIMVLACILTLGATVSTAMGMIINAKYGQAAQGNMIVGVATIEAVAAAFVMWTESGAAAASKSIVVPVTMSAMIGSMSEAIVRMLNKKTDMYKDKDDWTHTKHEEK